MRFVPQIGLQVGGFECYITADDEENEAAEVYKDGPADGEDDDDGPINIDPVSNTLNLVVREEGSV